MLAGDNPTENNWMEPPKDPVKDIRQTPLDLLPQFEWADTNIDDSAVAKVRDLLCACELTLFPGGV